MKQEERIDKHDERIGKIEQKLNNGLSHVPGMMKWIIALFISVLVATAGWGGSIMYRLARVETLLEAHINITGASETASK